MVLLRIVAEILYKFIIGKNDVEKRVIVNEKDIPTMEAMAAPGLMTLLDMALYGNSQGELTATICAANVLLKTILRLKQLSCLYLSNQYHRVPTSATTQNSTNLDVLEQFAKLCHDSAKEAIDCITTDKFANTANLDPETRAERHAAEAGEHKSSSSSNSFAQSVLDSIDHQEHLQNMALPQECWESPRLYCPDYVWAEEVISTCQRLLKNMCKHRVATFSFGNHYPNHMTTMMDDISSSSNSKSGNSSSSLSEMILEHGEIYDICQLLHNELPLSLHQFHAAIESNAAVSKRLYLVKMEYRAPFRAFLESQLLVQRTPNISIVQSFLQNNNNSNNNKNKNNNNNNNNSTASYERKLKNALQDPTLVKALQLEETCEFLEICMAKILHPFCELARYLDHKKARIKPTSKHINADDIPQLDALLRRLKLILCRKSNNNHDTASSTGIRPLLLELQGEMPQCSYEIAPFGDYKELSIEEATTCRFQEFLSQLQSLHDLTKLKNGFIYQESKKDSDIPQSIMKGCNNLDTEMLEAQFKDWCDTVHNQHQLCDDNRQSLKQLAETIKNTEIEMSFSKASQNSLELFQQRVELIREDRLQRFNVLQEMMDEISFREFDFRLKLDLPREDLVLELPQLESAPGIFGELLVREGESLPLG